jgi:integrase
VRISAGKHPATGKRIQKSLTVHGSRSDAKRALHELQAQRYAGSLLPSSMTLDQIVKAWLAAPTKGGRKRAETTSYHDWNRYQRYVQPTLGGSRADGLRPADFMRLYQCLIVELGLSPRSVHHVHSMLRAALNWGWKHELLATRAIAKVDAPSVALSPPQAPDISMVLKHLDVLSRSAPDLWLAVFLAGSMGLRRSEIAGLRWSHIDFRAETLTICEGVVVVPGHGVVTTRTKTGLHGFARFQLHPTSFNALVTKYSELGQRLIAIGETATADRYVFSSDLLCEKPIDPDLLSKWLRKHCESNPDLLPITFQSLRKFTSSALEGGGVDETTASALLRDRPETVSRHYRAAHVTRVRIATLQLGDLLTNQN